MRKRFFRWLTGLAVLVGGSASVFGTPTGLNNIPTADTVPHRTVAWQGFLNLGGPNAVNGVPGYGPTGKGTLWTGFKTGLQLQRVRLEWGLDTPILPGQAGPLAFQTKVGFNPWENGSVVVGVANVALTDTRRSAEPFTYGVVTQDFGRLRVHAGYGYQAYGQAGIGSSSLLAGVDRTFKGSEPQCGCDSDGAAARVASGGWGEVQLEFARCFRGLGKLSGARKGKWDGENQLCFHLLI
jgi:hypothetical protein